MIDKIKELRRITQTGYIDCKKALEEANGDISKAEEILTKRGLKILKEKPTRASDCGAIVSYIHPGNRVGVLISLSCHTDFVAKTEEFLGFAKDVAMQVAAMNPKFLSRDCISSGMLAEEKEMRIQRLTKRKIDESRFEAIIEAEIRQWYSETCLLEQPFVRDGRKTISELLAALINKTGENCRISKFTRWEIGE